MYSAQNTNAHACMYNVRAIAIGHLVQSAKFVPKRDLDGLSELFCDTGGAPLMESGAEADN